MRHLKISVQVFVLALILLGISSQNEICNFYGLEANCRYRIDAVSLSHIRAEIDQCADPIEVTFYIKNERPLVDFKYTFNSADTLVSVPRFTVRTQLRVRLTKKEDDVINVEADFYVYGQARADFINDDIKLRGMEEHCPFLNTAAKIAIGVMGGLAVIAAILILSLVFIRYKRRKKRAANAENQLVQNAAELGTSSPLPSLTNINEDHHVTSGHVTSINGPDVETNNTQRNANDNRTSENDGINGTVRNGDSRERSAILDEERPRYGDRNLINGERPSHDGEHNDCSKKGNVTDGLDVTFTEVLKSRNLKISDC